VESPVAWDDDVIEAAWRRRVTAQTLPFRRTASCSSNSSSFCRPASGARAMGLTTPVPSASESALSALSTAGTTCGEGTTTAPGQSHASSPVVEEDSGASGMPRIVAVGHSLGGTSLLLYMLLCGALGVSHGVERLVCLSPAGFHKEMPAVIRLVTNAAALVLKPAGCVACSHVPCTMYHVDGVLCGCEPCHRYLRHWVLPSVLPIVGLLLIVYALWRCASLFSLLCMHVCVLWTGWCTGMVPSPWPPTSCSSTLPDCCKVSRCCQVLGWSEGQPCDCAQRTARTTHRVHTCTHSPLVQVRCR
jgi:hypothetical protein